MNKKITVIGAGAWGTAVAQHLATNGYHVTLWCNEPAVAQVINTEHCNKTYLPDIILHQALQATNDMAYAVSTADILVEAVPVAYLRSVLERVKPYAKVETPWIVLSKGIEQNTLFLPSQIIQDVLGESTKFAAVGGPNFAKELVAQQFTATMIASTDVAWVEAVASLFRNTNFVVHISQDPIGVQLGGALKNVIALLIGIAHGAGYGLNTTAYLITQGLAEVATLVQRMNGDTQTVYGLAGVGDLVLTCTGTLSKNLRAGTLLGKGVLLVDLVEHMPVLPEGINTAQSLYEIIMRLDVNLPLLKGTYECIFEGKSVRDVINTSQTISHVHQHTF